MKQINKKKQRAKGINEGDRKSNKKRIKRLL